MKARSIVSLTTHIGALPELATVVLPVATHAEMSGTFVNAKGMAQTFKSAIRPPLGVRPAWEVLVDLARAMDLALEFKSLGDVHKAMPARASGLRPEVRA